MADEKNQQKDQATTVLRSEQVQRDRQKTTEAATSVGEAVKRATDAIVAAAQKVEVGPESDFVFSGTPGGRFTIHGNWFRAGGTVKVNGQQAQTDSWSNERITGHLPPGVGSGVMNVEVILDEQNKKTGTFRL